MKKVFETGNRQLLGCGLWTKVELILNKAQGMVMVPMGLNVVQGQAVDYSCKAGDAMSSL